MVFSLKTTFMNSNSVYKCVASEKLIQYATTMRYIADTLCQPIVSIEKCSIEFIKITSNYDSATVVIGHYGV